MGSYTLLLWPKADETLRRLERDPTLEHVNATLDKLETEPFESRLATRMFQSPEYIGVRATPVRKDDWYVLWRVSDAEERTIEIVFITVLTF